jgi:hypothetical protein
MAFTMSSLCRLPGSVWGGKRFARLTAVRFAMGGRRGARWVFRCDCGRLETIAVRFAIRGGATDCGCSAKASEQANEPPAEVWPFPKWTLTDGAWKSSAGAMADKQTAPRVPSPRKLSLL